MSNIERPCGGARLAARFRIDERFKVGQKRRLLCRHRRASGSPTPHAAWSDIGSLTAHLAQSIADRAARDPGRPTDCCDAADAVIQESAQKAHADLARAIATAAQAVARDAARRQMLQWLVAGMALGAALMMIGAIIGAKWLGG